MCFVCIANVMLTAAGATSTGGLTMFAIKNFVSKPDRNNQTNETKKNENRDIGIENKQERSES
jgi:hypothetical protein